MNEAITEKLFLRYQQKGFLTNDEILSELIGQGISIIQTERICSELLQKGVLISSATPKNQRKLQTEEEYDKTQIDYNELYDKIIREDESLRFIVGYAKKIQPPQLHEVEKLYPQIKSGNKFARNRLFEMNMRNVLRIAYQQSKKFWLPLSDTIQDGMIGLHVAIDKFDLSKHDKFQGYSTYWILNFINRNKNIASSVFTIPAHIRDLHDKIYKYILFYHKDFFESKYVPYDLIIELQSFFGIDRDKAFEHLRLLLPTMEIEEKESYTHLDFFDERLCNDNLAGDLNEASMLLKPRERSILKLRFGLYTENDSDFTKIQTIVTEKIWHGDGIYNYSIPLTLDEIAKIYNLTRERIRQIETRALKKIKENELCIAVLREYFE